jgi:acetyl esterase/lipase
MKSVCFRVLAALAIASPAVAQPTFPNLTYATLDGQPLQLDLYIPTTGPGPYPLVVWIHGGGWSAGDKALGPGAPALKLLPRGIAVASINYRLTSQAGQWGSFPVIFPAQINDVKGAVRWLRANAATYGLDVSHFGSWGSSAGGHLSALVGTSGGVAALEGSVGGNLAFSSAVQAAADYFGPTDIININLDVTTPPGSTINHDAPTSPESRLIGFDDPGQGIAVLRANLGNPNPPFPALVTLANQVSPITFVDPTDPPFYLAHGTVDTSVPIMQSTRLDVALTSAGVPHSYTQVAGAGHGSLGVTTDDALVCFFVSRFLGTACTPSCYANCDGSTATPLLTPNDFACFMNRYVNRAAYANCDDSTVPPVFTPNDFLCFVNSYAAGCS